MKRRPPGFYFMVFLFFCCSELTAQQRIGRYLAYGRENGLPQLAYHDVFETSNGFLWISSNSGLFQFDGKRFRPFYALYDNPNSLSDNNIVDLEEDNNGNLWMAGFVYGLTRYNLKTGQFRQYRQLMPYPSATCQIMDLHKDKRGTLWVGIAGYGLAEYLPDKDTFRYYHPDPAQAALGFKYGTNYISGIKEDRNDPDRLWLSAFDGLYAFDKKNKTFTRYPFASQTPGETENFFCVENLGNKLYLGTWFRGLVEFDISTKTFRRISYQNNGKPPFQYGILDLQAVGDSVLYLASMNDGLLKYHPRTGVVTAELQSKDVNYLNSEINIQRVSYTPHWGLTAGGNSMIYQAHPVYHLYSSIVPYDVKPTYPREVQGISELEKDKWRNGYWMSVQNYNGLIFYDTVFRQRKLYPVTGNMSEWFEDIAVDGNGTVWALSQIGAVFRLNEKNNRFVWDTALQWKASVLDNGMKALCTDDAGNLWMAGKKQAACVNVKTGTVITLPYPQEALPSGSKKGIGFLSLVTSHRGQAWMSTDIGLFRMDKEKKEIIFLGDSLPGGKKLASKLIKTIAIDQNDRLWLGYFNEGIQVLNTQTGQIEHSYTVKNGLPVMEANHIVAGKDNKIYVTTHSGLAVYNPSVKTWQLINAQDGLIRDYLDVPVMITDRNVLVLDQREGVLVLPLDSLNKQQTGGVWSHISSVRVNDQELDAALLSQQQPALDLPPSARDITIEFSILNWFFPLRTKYFFRVDGVHREGEWIAQNDGRVSLTGLSSGKYTFRFYGITALGERTPERTLAIFIRPPFYKTAGFITLCVLLVGGLLYALYRYRINQLKKLYNMRYSISRDLHDDIGASLSNINILNELAKRHAGTETKTIQYLDKAGEDIQRVSESLSDIVWNINPKYDELQSLFIRMKRYASDMMDGKNIQYEIRISAEAEKLQLSMDIRRNFYLIFKEAVNNLVKYSGATYATVSLRTDNRQLLLEIIDNGTGFSISTVQQGNGLQNMQKRAAEMNGLFTIETAPGQGTRIRLSLPIT